MEDLLTQLRAYTPFDLSELATTQRFVDFVRSNDNCFERSLLIGHVTASAFVYDKNTKQVLLLHHKKLEKWLQPGGHCDGDSDTLGVALKEVFEETGVLVERNNQKIFDLDIHTIPERKGVPEHEHFDVRYLLEANSTLPLVQNHETNALNWINISDLEDFTKEDSLTRMKAKVLSLGY
jgi:8-oxo-dGTP pyrophosphatase MutT (NUDIX family)